MQNVSLRQRLIIMDEDALFKLYEKLYFHEIDIRERLNSRLQIPLTIIALLFGFLAYMLQNKCEGVGNNAEIVFWVLFSISICAVCSAIFFFILSWYSYKHKLLPSAISTDQYKNKLVEHYREHEVPEKLVKKYLKKYLYNYYRDFSSENTIINDRKSFYMHLTNMSLIFSIVLTFTTFIPYYFGSLDKSNLIEPVQVVIEQPVVLESYNSTEERKGDQNEQAKRFPSTQAPSSP